MQRPWNQRNNILQEHWATIGVNGALIAASTHLGLVGLRSCGPVMTTLLDESTVGIALIGGLGVVMRHGGNTVGRIYHGIFLILASCLILTYVQWMVRRSPAYCILLM